MATALRPATLGHESHKMLHLNTKKFTYRIVDQVTILVEFVSSTRDGNFRTAHNHRVEHCQTLPNVVLCKQSASAAVACTHERNTCAIEWLIRRTRRPIDNVFENAACRSIVFRGCNQDSIVIADSSAQCLNHFSAGVRDVQ